MIENVSGVEQPCPGCGGRFASMEGPTHPYMLSSVGCWAAFGEVLAREFENAVLFASSHRLTVDAYALQHPGDGTDRRATRSVRLHYASLYLLFEERRPFAHATAALERLADRDLEPLEDVPAGFAVTVRDVVGTAAEKHQEAVDLWARCAYGAWSHLREPTRVLLAAPEAE